MDFELVQQLFLHPRCQAFKQQTLKVLTYALVNHLRLHGTIVAFYFRRIGSSGQASTRVFIA
jgi:hypothetical protein